MNNYIEEYQKSTNDRLGFSSSEQDFLKKYEIVFSDAYVGMVRCYFDNRCIWQTSVWDPMISVSSMNIYNNPTPLRQCIENAKDQAKEFIKRLVLMSDQEIETLKNNNIHLFS